MTLTAKVSAGVTATFTGTSSVGGQSFSPKVEKIIQLANGTAANQADLIYAAERTVGDGSDDDIDLNAVLTDAFGATITAVEGVSLMVINQQADGTANTTDLTIGAGTNPWEGFLGGTTPTIGPIKPGGMFMIAAGDAAGIGTITATTADILRITNSAGAANSYQIAFIARSA